MRRGSIVVLLLASFCLVFNGCRTVLPRTGAIVSPSPKPGAEATAETAPAAKEATHVGSVNSVVFHSVDCAWADEMNPENIVYYTGREAALTDGRRPCKICKP